MESNMSAAAVRAKEEYLFDAGQKYAEASMNPQEIVVNDRHFIAYGKDLTEVPEKEADCVRFPKQIGFFSLAGLIDYIKADPDALFSDPGRMHMVRVSNEETVEILTPVTGERKERGIIAVCNAHAPTIPFHTFMDPDRFQVMLQTMFLRDPNLDLVLKISGALRKEQNVQTADDGVSQRVTINAGVATAADVTIKNPVDLQPMRTFQEIEQPVSPFVLRFNNEAQAALYEGDGGAWKVEAVSRIGAYLRANLAEQNVVVLA